MTLPSMQKGKLKVRPQGFATFEIIIALALLIACFSSILPLVAEQHAVAANSLLHQEAISRASALLEQAITKASLDFNLLNPMDAIENDPYTQSLSVAYFKENPLVKHVQSTIQWKNLNNQTITTSLATLVSGNEALENGEICNSLLSNPDNWKTPTYHVHRTADMTPDASSIAISRLYSHQGKLYVTSNPLSNTPTLFIFSISENLAEAPLFLGALDNAPVQAGLNAIAVSGNYAFLANAYGANFSNCLESNRCAQLQIADVANPRAPTIVKNVKMPGISGSAGQAVGNVVAYRNGYIYLGLAKTGNGPEFNIIDVGGGGPPASPLNPVWKGGYAIGNGINAIVIKNQLAYVVTPNVENMTILDVSQPENPIKAGGSPLFAGGNHGKSAYVIGKSIYLGRTFGQNEFYILDVSQPKTPLIMGAKDVGIGSQTSIHAIAVKDFLTFLLTRDQFQVWNTKNPSNIFPWTENGSENTFLRLSDIGGIGISFSCAEDDFFVALASPSGNGEDSIAIIASES